MRRQSELAAQCVDLIRKYDMLDRELAGCTSGYPFPLIGIFRGPLFKGPFIICPCLASFSKCSYYR